MEYKDFKNIPNCKAFYSGSDIVLKNTLVDLLSAQVTIINNPIQWCPKKVNVDILSNPDRNLYVLSDNKVLLVPKVHTKNVDYFLGILLEAKEIGCIYKVLHRVCELIIRALCDDYKTHFMAGYSLYNQNLAQAIVVKIISIGGYNQHKASALIDMMNAIRTTTFEGKYFSTGLIITKSLHDYQKAHEEIGETTEISQTYPIFDKIDKRFWYLVDGEKNFYLSSLKGTIRHLYSYNNREGDYISKMVLQETMQGKDFLIRTTNGRELSVITSKGEEFIYQENAWRYRNYDLLKQRIIKTLPQLSDDVYNSILYYVLYCSKNDISSIIWIVKETESIETIPALKSFNLFTTTPIQITDIGYGGVIKRLISSDGAVAVSQTGDILYYGCIVDLSKIEVEGVKGTGETAASALANYGVAIKISQDGCIKIHLDAETEIIF